ncbi:fatty acid oxidation complex subunit alpha FadB [Pseudomonas sp. NW5]|uniref:fatty acid oxidation complex subunit alpha FadB n=1 Tax=Pseudomonas sp. NW5 TaxID=2934934 RepID=UPI00202205F1|nr:fatty acid oxidation complex subunit alpha FadB [Pseudomonas sp. NW5]MCL7461667.1 fatty acid oxidation complex subunit alpha FadB [Pseudomonas sp. NW5]
MIYQGKAIRVTALADEIAELCFDREGETVNKFDRLTLNELNEAVQALRTHVPLRAVLVTSAKDGFIVGADIGEFLDSFRQPAEVLQAWLQQSASYFSAFEDLPVPSVAAVHGVALGGGLEMALAADFRVLAEDARVGLPEVKLGINPGFGGTVRLPRLIGADNAIEWIATGKEHDAAAALRVGVADAVVARAALRDQALALCRRAIAGELDYRARRQLKQAPLQLAPVEQLMVFETARAFVAAQAGPHYPAPLQAVKTLQQAATLDREAAQVVEAQAFVKLAGTEVSRSLVGLFLNDQLLKKKARAAERAARPVRQAAVLGAGIMGGGIAYQSALKGTPILLKDVREQALQLGLDEAARLLARRVEQGRMTVLEMANVLNSIRPTLSYGDFAGVDLLVEAVVENPTVKRSVLAEVEQQVGEEAILTSNTSTISIDHLAEVLKRPENFCGMHFFNPVHRMPLVEVIRGRQSSEQTIATVVAWARRMGKTPVVVNDCPGFLVNRVLFPYFAGFTRLLAMGIDFARIDRVMERFGWPMGPAYLLDVVGIDTAHHARAVLAAGYPERMQETTRTALDALYDEGRLGQKSGRGFYRYEAEAGGKPKKQSDPSVEACLAPLVGEVRELSDEEIVAILMLPLCLETVRCLEEGVVASAAEADMGLIYGLGFPAFRGGALRYIESLGLAEYVALADRHAALGALYTPTARLREMAASGRTFYGQ